MLSRYPRPRRSIPTSPTSLPDEAVPAWLPLESRKYLQSRGISEVETGNYDLHYCDSGFWKRRILIPMYGDSDELVAFQGRLIDEGEPRYWTEGPRPIYCPTRPDGQTPWVTVEGPFDVFAVQRVLPAVATLGILPSDHQILTLTRMVSRIGQPVLVWFDPEALAEAFQLQLRLAPYGRISVVESPLPSPSSDPGSLSPMAIEQILRPFLEE